jgi:hypothetical protein
MKLRNGEEVRKSDPRHKYSSALCEYVFAVGEWDEDTGDVESPTGWFARRGRWIVTEDAQGFCERVKVPTVGDAMAAYSAADHEYRGWFAASEDEDEDGGAL